MEKNSNFKSREYEFRDKSLNVSYRNRIKFIREKFYGKVYEVHHKHKKDHPSGTALMLGKGIAVGKRQFL